MEPLFTHSLPSCFPEVFNPKPSSNANPNPSPNPSVSTSPIKAIVVHIANPSSNPNPSPNPNVSTSPIKAIVVHMAHTCPVCGKEFKSAKAVHGHMRFHPDRDWRGMNDSNSQPTVKKKKKKTTESKRKGKKTKKSSKKNVKKNELVAHIIDLNHPKRRWRMGEVYEKPIIY